MAATSSSVYSFHFSASSARRPPINSPSLSLAQLPSSFSSFTQPLIRELRRTPASVGMARLIEKASGRLLDAFVDFAFQFADQPWLPSQSNFMSVDEVDEAVIITNIEGEIPHDFPDGVYIRNGSNPLFGTLQSSSSVLGQSSETWVEGEGMLHALSFSRATAAPNAGGWTLSYKNRYVESKSLQLERRRNHPAFLPVLEGDAPAILASSLLNQLRFGKVAKDVCNTNVFEISGKFYAIAENHMPVEIDLLSLETIGDWDLSGAWNRPFIAHPKKAPGGELVFVGADGRKPFLVLGIVSADGKVLKHKVDLKLERGILCHDFGVTRRYNIILDMPLAFDWARLLKGGPLVKYDKESYARIGVMPRYGDSHSIKWFDVEPFCTFHIVNCYEDGDEVVVRGGRSRGSIIPGPAFGRNKFQWFSSGFKLKSTAEDCDNNSNEGLFLSRLHEWRLNMKTGSVRERYMTKSDFFYEFHTCNDLFVGLHNQYAYAQVLNSVESSICGLPKHGGLAKFYLDEKDSSRMENDGGGYIKVERHQLCANEFCSGAAFVSKMGGVREDDGWVISFVHNEDTNTSQVHIIDARNFEDEPVAKITLPKRVPYGFHGAFFPMLDRL